MGENNKPSIATDETKQSRRGHGNRAHSNLPVKSNLAQSNSSVKSNRAQPNLSVKSVCAQSNKPVKSCFRRGDDRSIIDRTRKTRSQPSRLSGTAVPELGGLQSGDTAHVSSLCLHHHEQQQPYMDGRTR